MDYNGTNFVRLTNNSVSIGDNDPRFGTAGRRIVFASNRSDSNYEIHVMNAAGSGVTRLTNAPGADIQPAFSPNGARIVFIGNRPSTPQGTIWSMDADGSDPLRLRDSGSGFLDENLNPVYSPDGTRIAFDSRRGPLNNFNVDIYSIVTDGSDERRLTTTAGDDLQPAYSRDGSSMVFISWRDGSAQNGEIYTMKADGTGRRRITSTTFKETELTFSIDGAQIVFSANYNGTPDLYAINRDGSGLRRITTQPSGFLSNPTLAPQPDLDGDGIGDACDSSFDAATPTGAAVVVQTGGASVEYAGVCGAGVTTFTTIEPDANTLPTGFTLCNECPAFDITTTATFVPPIRVCLVVPGGVATGVFLQLRLLHGENGVWVDRTSQHIDTQGQPRQVCGIVNSLSPVALAAFVGTPAGDAVFANGVE